MKLNSLQELFAIPIGTSKYIIYAPSRCIAFVGNSSMVNAIADIDPGLHASAIDSLAMNFLRNDSLVESIKGYKDRKTPIFPVLSIDLSSNLNSSDRDSTGNCLTNYQGHQKIDHEFLLKKIDSAINIMTKMALETGSKGLNIQVYNSEKIECISDIIPDIFSLAESVMQRKDIQLTSNIKISQPLELKRIKEQLKWFDTATVILPIPIHDTTSIEEKRYCKGFLNGWLETLLTLDDINLPYSVNCNVLTNQIHLLSASVRYLFENYHMEEIIIGTDFLDYSPTKNPTSHTERLLSEIRKATSIAAIFNRRMFFTGTDLDNPQDFCGFGSNDYELLQDGAITSSHSGKIHTGILPRDEILAVDELIPNMSQNFCKGCFAKINCLGPNNHDKGKKEHQNSFTGYERCYLIQELTKDQLIGKIAASGGMAWIDIDNKISLQKGYKRPDETRFLP